MTDIELKNLKDNLWHSADMLRAGAHLAPTNMGNLSLGLSFSVMLMCFSNSIKRK